MNEESKKKLSWEGNGLQSSLAGNELSLLVFVNGIKSFISNSMANSIANVTSCIAKNNNKKL